MSSEPWDEELFNLFVTHHSLTNPNYLQTILNKLVIPFYTEKFELYGKLLDSNGNLIKYIDERPK